MNFRTFCLLFAALACVTFAKAETDPQTLFFESVAAYNKGDLDQAQVLLSQYLVQRPNDAHAHINMANIAFKKKSWGPALAHTRRAKSLDPQISGLSTLEQSLASSSPSGNGLAGPFHKIIRPRVTSLPQLPVLLIGLLAFGGFGHLFISHLKKKKWAAASEEPMPSLGWSPILLAILSICAFVLFGLNLFVSQMNLATAIKTTGVFSAPDNGSFELGTLAEGSEVKLLSESENWAQVSNGSELSGWVEKQAILKHKGP